MRERISLFAPSDLHHAVWNSASDERFGLGPYMIVDGKLFALKETGELYVYDIQPRSLRLIRSQPIIADASDAWGPMAYADGMLLVRDAKRVCCVKIKAEGWRKKAEGRRLRAEGWGMKAERVKNVKWKLIKSKINERINESSSLPEGRRLSSGGNPLCRRCGTSFMEDAHPTWRAVLRSIFLNSNCARWISVRLCVALSAHVWFRAARRCSVDQYDRWRGTGAEHS